MSGKEFLGKKVCACVTCDLWKGELRKPTGDRKEVEYETFQRGVCSGPLKTGESTTPLNKCRAWRLWKVMNRPRTVADKDYGSVDPFAARDAR